jgi:penicillin-binding protein 1A
MANGQGPGWRFNGLGRGQPVNRTPLQKMLYWGTVTGVWGLIVIVIVFIGLAWDLPDTSNLNKVTRQPTISYLDRSGAVLAVRGSQYAPPVDLDLLPKYVPDAFIAIEDQHFYQHFGFNPWGIFRSAIYNVGHRGGPMRGGSTITQQLARNLFLSADQNYRRKGQELLIAMILEVKYSKKEILALYLNRIYFGHGAYGIDAAATRYFNKPAKDLTLGEAAMLAGLVKGPSRYSPVSDQDRAKKRTELVLSTMLKSKKITREQYDDVFRTPVMISRTLASQNAQYFVDFVDAKVRSLVGEPTENMVVETTLDLPIELAAETAIRQIVTRDSKARGVQQAALVALDGEGRIRAYVGGADYGESQYDRASLAQRQAGSSFKPFVYLTAMDQGRTPYDPVVDEPVNIGGWSPKNYDGDYKGAMTLQTALAKSINTVAARLASDVGTGNVKATAQRLGITGNIQTAPSMALGAVEVTPIQMAQAYAPFSNGGYSAMGYGIERIRTTTGRVLYDHGLRKPDRRGVIGSPALQYMNQMLRQVICCGTGTRARVGGYDIAGKTGTTSDYKDAWFVGYTGGFVAAVWVGKDNNTPMGRGVTGGGPPAEIWRNFMAATLPRLRVMNIPGGAAPGAPDLPPPGADPIGDLLNNAQQPEGAPPAGQPPVATPAPVPAAPSSVPY